jgi:IS1 family transposase/transposase-like protein
MEGPMLESWPNLLLHDLLGVMLGWLVLEIWQHWRDVRRFERRWSQQLVRQRRREALAESRSLPGLARRPVCAECEADAEQKEEAPSPPPRWPGSKRGRRQAVTPTWQYCDDPECEYYGWPGLGNLRANGFPNGGRWRQWHCQACRQFFIETRGTPLYRRPVAPKLIHQVLTALAEGLSLEATARLFEVEPETVAQWLALAANHFEALSAYLSQNLDIAQVQLDDLYVKLRAVQGNDRTSVRWLYNAIDPVSKFWLTFRLGERGLVTVQSLVHQLVEQLAPGVMPLFLSDGERSFETGLLSHYGHWGQLVDGRGRSRRRWLGLAELAYVQVVKRRVRRRLVSVKHRLVSGQLTTIKDRLVSGQLTTIKARLAEHGWGINTALIERFNLTLRQHVPALRRRVLALARSEAGLQHQLTLVQLYYNLCLRYSPR